MGDDESDFIRNADNQKIYVRSWVPSCDPVAVLYITHGVGEYGGRYEQLGVYLRDNNIAVHTQDFVGHGKSDGDRVHIDDFQIYVRDVVQHIELLKAKYTNIPVFLMGHSMGGIVSTLFAIQRPELINGVVFSAPALLLGAGTFTRGLVRAVAYFVPQLVVRKSDPSVLTRDPDEIRNYMEDPLIWRGGLKAGWVTAIFDAQLQVANGVSAIKLPFITLHGTADTMVDISSSQFLMENTQSEDKTFERFEDGRHKLLVDLDRERFKQVILDWLNKHITSSQ
ncbi:monoglyceride lipase-like [Dysidea avara]|uniref:monoglyceride lipase-like n=1 Tax=Dysidea avara TaxID=196820 RepID=UPI003330A559